MSVEPFGTGEDLIFEGQNRSIAGCSLTLDKITQMKPTTTKALELKVEGQENPDNGSSSVEYSLIVVLCSLIVADLISSRAH